MHDLITKQRFVNAHQIQADFASVCREASQKRVFVQILRHNTPQGVYLPQTLWEDFLSALDDTEGDYREIFIKEVFSAARERPTQTFKNARSLLKELSS